jgi:hypothetical protein
VLTAHNAARPTETAPRKRRLFIKVVPSAGHFWRRRVRYFNFSADFRTFNNRRLLETGPAAVRNTLVASGQTKKNVIYSGHIKN